MQNHEQQLNRYIDKVLGPGVPVEHENNLDFDPRDKKIIHALSTADFSMESRVRQSLKQKLLTKQKETTMYNITGRKPMLRLTLIGTLMALLILAFTPLGTTLAQSIVNIIQTWRLGDGTTAVSVEGDFVAIQDENGETVIQPAPLEEPSREELIEEGGTPALGTNLAIEQASELVSFKLLQPTFIPEGYDFQGVTVGNPEQAQMDYVKFEEIGLIGLGQTVVGGINGNVQVTFSSDMTPVEVQVNGQDGLWIATDDGSGMLMWEADGINYQLQLMGVGKLELALQIAESLE